MKRSQLKRRQRLIILYISQELGQKLIITMIWEKRSGDKKKQKQQLDDDDDRNHQQQSTL